MVQAAVFSITLAGRIDEDEIARFARGIGRLAFTREIELLERQRDLLRETDADESAGRHSIAIANEPHGLSGAHHFPLLGGPQVWQCRMLRHLSVSRLQPCRERDA